MVKILILLSLLACGPGDKIENTNKTLSKTLEKTLRGKQLSLDKQKISRTNFERFNQSGKDWYPVFLRTVKLYKIVNPELYLANILYESQGFLYEVENLNYSAKRLKDIFPTHFKDEKEREEYAHHPQLIANRVYSNRLGNGDEASGDGWKFRGRGFLQITGKSNYQLLANEYNKIVHPMAPITAEDMVLFAESRWGAIHVSSLWWVISNCNNEQVTVFQATRRISGSDRTAPDRDLIYKKILSYERI